MVKFVALYKQPADRAAFDQHYFDIHVPLCKVVPNLLKMEVTRFTGTPRGESEYYLMSELYFADHQTMMDALMGEAGMATAKDARIFGKDIFTGIFAEVVEGATVTV